VYNSREELLKDCADFFILFREKDTINTSMDYDLSQLEGER
jgi:hypothetical protein